MLRAAAYQYQFYEMAHAALAPARAVSDAAYFMFRNPFNPFSATPFGKNMAAGAELFERMTRRYGKPVFGLKTTVVDGVAHDVLEEIVWSRPFGNLLRFVRPSLPGHEAQPKLLIVAPMSGHYATLLRGTVEADETFLGGPEPGVRGRGGLSIRAGADGELYARTRRSAAKHSIIPFATLFGSHENFIWVSR